MEHCLLYFRRFDRITDFAAFAEELAAADLRYLALAPKLGGLDFSDERDAASARKILADHGIQARGIHGLFAGDLDLNAEDSVKAAQAHRKLMANAAGLGVKTYVVHGGWRNPASPESYQWDCVRRCLSEMLPLAEELGLVIAVENLPPEYLGNDPADLLRLIKEFDSCSLRLCFDSGHANLNGDATQILRQMSAYVATMHLHDNRTDRDSHLAPGEGTIDWESLSREIRVCASARHVEIEGFNHADLPHREFYQHYLQLLSLGGQLGLDIVNKC